MKKTIAKNEYDTANAVMVHSHTYSYFGDPCGYEETLYMTEKGLYFLYVNGGAESPYPTEDILRIAKAKAKLWLESRCA